MQQFALASVYPRSIAWLTRLDEWERFEEIIKYNCAMVGGYFNVIVPLTDQDTISEEYQQFLVDYDPDLVVLAPGMISNELDSLLTRIHPFGVIPWESVGQIAILDPWGGGTFFNATLGTAVTFKKDNMPERPFIAVADQSIPEMSRFAFVACGDVEPREPMWQIMDEDISLSATGHREMFLEKLFKLEYDRTLAGTYIGKEEKIFPAPTRFQLTDMIKEEYKFPLDGADKILEACCRLQEHPQLYQSFIGMTADYKKGGSPKRTYQARGDKTPSIVILISDKFDLQRAVLFWNLRAAAFYVIWLPFSELEANPDAVLKWLESDYGGGFYSMMGKSMSILFSSSEEDLSRLNIVVNNLRKKRYKKSPIIWNVESHNYLIFYDYSRPYIKQERIMVAKDGVRCSFIPKLPQGYNTGEYIITLEWSGFTVPPNSVLIRNWVSTEEMKDLFPFLKSRHRNGKIPKSIVMPRFRIGNDRYLKVQISSETPVEFNRPSAEQVIETLFTTAGFPRIEQTSAAKYHLSFIHRAGNLDDTTTYLAISPYRELFELLADNSNTNKPGWLLSNPSGRRALHHLHLREILGQKTPDDIKRYFNKEADELPDEAIELLEKGILERGFHLTCSACSFKSWYPAEHVGQTFECSRCFHTQVYRSNPLWLYKLPEVIFQGFQDNMHVPLLALSYLKRRSQHAFEWVPDSNVYWTENDKETHRNLDIICLCDGKLYIGEAKSNDKIGEDQFSFYENMCKRVPLDGIVFATSKSQWVSGTLQRIERLKAQYSAEILLLTEKELYSKPR